MTTRKKTDRRDFAVSRLVKVVDDLRREIDRLKELYARGISGPALCENCTHRQKMIDGDDWLICEIFPEDGPADFSGSYRVFGSSIIVGRKSWCNLFEARGEP